MVFNDLLLGEQSATAAEKKNPKNTHFSVSVINAEASLFHSSKCFLPRFLYLPLSRSELQPGHFLHVLDVCDTKGREIKPRIDA